MITPNILFKIRNTYKSNCLDPIDDNPAFPKTFNDFCVMMNLLDNEKRDMLIFLLGDYIKKGLVDYSKDLYNLFLIVNSTLKTKSHICFLPLVNTIKSNSSQYLSYYAKLPAFRKIFADKKITSELDDINVSELVKKINESKIDYCIFLDDFIGTGDTADDELKIYLEAGLKPEKIIIISLVIQNNGLERLQKKYHQVFFIELVSRGISDNSRLSKKERSNFLRIMGEIEDIINVKDGNKYRFGYKKSEALVTMLKTPNNTFPIFWKPNGKKNEGGIIAPFPK